MSDAAKISARLFEACHHQDIIDRARQRQTNEPEADQYQSCYGDH